MAELSLNAGMLQGVGTKLQFKKEVKGTLGMWEKASEAAVASGLPCSRQLAVPVLSFDRSVNL